MRIGIDMRMAGTGEGIGRYIEELVIHLAKIDHENQYFLFLAEHDAANPKSEFLISKQIPNSNFQIIKVKSKYYSWAEQTRFIWELKKLRLDLMHFASFNFPIFYPGKFIVTIHDLIHHQFPGKKKSRFFHRFAYRLVIGRAVARAAKIIAVSEATKISLENTFHLKEGHVVVIYEGIKNQFFEKISPQETEQIKAKFGITKPYVLFVGVWRQYKNLPRLAAAFDIIKERFGFDCQMVLAGKIDPFYPEIRNQVMGIKKSSDVRALGFVSDEDLQGLYQGARVFVLPSLVEGFGLIGLEAQGFDVPVVCSDIPVLQEILGDGALFFDPASPPDMAEKLAAAITDKNLRDQLTRQGKINMQRFSWEKAARETLKIYEDAGKRN